MIKSLSSYYINIPFLSPLTSDVAIEYTLLIWVWNGTKFNPPVEPTYSKTKKNIDSSVDTDEINIARLVNDFIEFTPQLGAGTGVYDGNNQRWVKTAVIYNTGNPIDTDVVQLQTTVLMLKGYGYGMQGENPQPPTNRILLQGTEFKVQRNGFFNLPIIIDMTLLERVEALEAEAEATALITAVFVPDGAMIAWNKPAGTIPTGWAEVVDFRGKTLVGKDTSGFFGTLGANVGSNDAVVVEHDHDLVIPASSGAGGINAVQFNGDNNSPVTLTTELAGESGTNKNVQASRIVHFIEYIG